MNICPNCGKEVSEDAVHCGHCGHRIKAEDKKTMMGLGAVDPEDWKERVKEAEAERQQEVPDSEKDSVAMEKTELMDPVELPTPEDSSSPIEEDEGEFGTAPTAAMDQVDVKAQIGGADSDTGDDSEAATEPGLDIAPTQEEETVSPPDSSMDGPEPARQEDWEIGALDDEKDSGPGASPISSEAGSQEHSFDDELGASGIDDERSEPSFGGGGGDNPPPAGDQNGPSAMGEGNSGGELMTTDGGGAGGQEDKSRRRMLMIVGAMFLVVGGCCVATAVGAWVFGGDMFDELSEFEVEIEEEFEGEFDESDFGE